jgi:hypothetical protein
MFLSTRLESSSDMKTTCLGGTWRFCLRYSPPGWSPPTACRPPGWLLSGCVSDDALHQDGILREYGDPLAGYYLAVLLMIYQARVL